MAETQEIIQREAPEIEALKLGLLQSAKDLADQPITMPTQQVAAPSGLQEAAFGLTEAGIGAYRPFLEEAGLTMGEGYAPITGAQQQAIDYIQPGVATGQSMLAEGAGPITGEMIQGYMNPYQQAVQDEINRAYNIQAAQSGLQAAGAGAFGGGRAAISEAEINRNRASSLAQAQAQNFLQAQQAAQNQLLRQQQAGQQIGSLGLQAGQQVGTLGLQTGEALGTLGLRQSALGETLSERLLREQQGVFEMGARQQAQQQAELEAQRQGELAQLYEPYQRVSFLSDIYKGAPSTQQTISAAASPSVSPAQQFLGLGIAGLGAAAGAAKSGLFG
tara:strand:+ start:4589 stop:5584 length:996 start_codon:yes stop_codon:yes gene_type:complete